MDRTEARRAKQDRRGQNSSQPGRPVRRDAPSRAGSRIRRRAETAVRPPAGPPSTERASAYSGRRVAGRSAKTTRSGGPRAARRPGERARRVRSGRPRPALVRSGPVRCRGRDGEGREGGEGRERRQAWRSAAVRRARLADFSPLSQCLRHCRRGGREPQPAPRPAGGTGGYFCTCLSALYQLISRQTWSEGSTPSGSPGQGGRVRLAQSSRRFALYAAFVVRTRRLHKKHHAEPTTEDV